MTTKNQTIPWQSTSRELPKPETVVLCERRGRNPYEYRLLRLTEAGVWVDSATGKKVLEPTIWVYAYGLYGDEGKPLTINEKKFYKLGYPSEEIVPGNFLTDAREVYWCGVQQEWRDA